MVQLQLGSKMNIVEKVGPTTVVALFLAISTFVACISAQISIDNTRKEDRVITDNTIKTCKFQEESVYTRNSLNNSAVYIFKCGSSLKVLDKNLFVDYIYINKQ